MLNPILKKELPETEYCRYAKQIIVKEISHEGQQRLKRAKILCLGLGGLNSPALLYLAACGIGNLGIVDQDRIELSNLQRQIIYSTYDINKKKVKAAFNTLKSLNPQIIINSHNHFLTQNNIERILYKYDIIIDGTDNLKIRYILSQYCYALHKIHIYGAIDKFSGQVSVFNYQNGPHYYSLYKNTPNIKSNSCNNIGLINTVAGMTGTLQATEAIKIITGIGSITSEHLLIFNVLQSSLNRVKIKKQNITNTSVITSLKKDRYRYITHDNLYNYETLLIDVRTSTEFNNHHINKSINIPLNLIKKKASLQFFRNSKFRTIILYCDNESRSYVASQILYKYKITSYILQGGIQAIRKERDSNPR